MGSDRSSTCLHPNRKGPGKVPKRIHKAEREKKKRERLNELFLDLADALGLTEQNSGKASILGETTRIVKDVLDQIESLKKENATLLSESQYVTVEKNELQDETWTLQTQIGELKKTIKERIDLNASPEEEALKVHACDPFLNPVFVMPSCHNNNIEVGPKPISNVSKPNPRYPTPSDSWPFQLLEKQHH